MRPEPPTQGGVTLIELVISIVIIAIAVSGVLSLVGFVTGRSADPILQRQAVAIAEAYLDEIAPKSYEPLPGTTRPTFDDVRDYDGLVDTGARDQGGNPIPGLGDYTVRVQVTDTTLGSSAPQDALRILVTVSHPDLQADVEIASYRTEH